MRSSLASQNLVQSEVCVCVFAGSALQREEKRIALQNTHTHFTLD